MANELMTLNEALCELEAFPKNGHEAGAEAYRRIAWSFVNGGMEMVGSEVLDKEMDYRTASAVWDAKKDRIAAWLEERKQPAWVKEMLR